MDYSIHFVLIFLLGNASLQSTKIDPMQLKCLVCKTTVDELHEAIGQIDPTHKIDIGGYRIDSKGNLQQKQVLKSKSETHLSDLASTICDAMDNYIRGTWKDDNTLTIFKLIENGQMSKKFNMVNIIQDDDLNKSLKYYCQEIIEENEEEIIKQYLTNDENIADAANISEVICIEQAKYCSLNDFIEKEHVEVQGSDNFASQFGLDQNFDIDSEQLATDSESTSELKDSDKVDIGVESLDKVKEEL